MELRKLGLVGWQVDCSVVDQEVVVVVLEAVGNLLKEGMSLAV